MSFLPTDYKIPSQSNYMKLEKGSNKLRVLDSAITGFEWWEEDQNGGRKPHRRRTFQEAVKQGQEPIKHFWAFPVWNYATQSVQILEITQKSVMAMITSYVNNEDWGDPKEYDLTVNREGDGFDTEYTVIASPHKKVTDEVVQAYKNTSINLNALYEGKDPFQPEDIAETAAKALK